jgi:hypothetical protein
MSEGHPHARKYPLSTMWMEAELVRERVNGRITTEATLMHAVIVAVLAPDGQGAKNLNKMLKDMTDGR